MNVCPHCGCWHREPQEGTYAAELDALRLSRLQRNILAAVARQKGGTLTISQTLDAAYGEREDGGPLAAVSTIRVTIHKLNRKIAPFGWAVENDYGHGYRLVRTAL